MAAVRAFYAAVERGDVEAVRAAVVGGTLPYDVLAAGFLQAATRGHLAIVRGLLPFVLDADADESIVYEAADRAGDNGHSAVVNYLLDLLDEMDVPLSQAAPIA